MCVCVCVYIYIYIYIYICCMYAVFMYMCIHVTMPRCAYVHTYICSVVYVVGLVLFSLIILLANISSRNIFLLRSRLNLYVTSFPITSQ